MKALAALITIVCCLLLYTIDRIERTLPLVRFINIDNTISEPYHFPLSEQVLRTSGKGKDSALLIDRSELQPDARSHPLNLFLLRFGLIVLGILGAIGFAIESQPEKTKQVHGQQLSPDLLERVRLVNEIADKIESGMRFHGVCYHEGEFSPEKIEQWCHVELTDDGLQMWNKEMSRTIPYSQMNKVSQTKWKGLGSGVKIVLNSGQFWMAPRRSNFRGWALGVDHSKTLALFQNLSRKVREAKKSKIDKPEIC